MAILKRMLSWIVLGVFLYLMLQSGGSKNQPLPSPETAPAQAIAPAQPDSETAPSDPAAPAQIPPASEATEEHKAFTKATDIERWKRALNPDYAANFQCTLPAIPGKDETPQLSWKVTEEKAGTGSGARCSQTITVKLIVWNARGVAAYTTHTELQLGARQIAAGLDAALIGLRNGGSRTVILGPSAQFRAENAKPAKALLTALGTDRMVVITVEREL